MDCGARFNINCTSHGEGKEELLSVWLRFTSPQDAQLFFFCLNCRLSDLVKQKDHFSWDFCSLCRDACRITHVYYFLSNNRNAELGSR